MKIIETHEYLLRLNEVGDGLEKEEEINILTLICKRDNIRV